MKGEARRGRCNAHRTRAFSLDTHTLSVVSELLSGGSQKEMQGNVCDGIMTTTDAGGSVATKAWPHPQWVEVD